MFVVTILEESKIYDKLAISVEGELLTDLYIQTKKSMVLENQGDLLPAR